MSVLAILHILAALACGIHAVRTGQPIYWLLILFMFPFLGSVVYGVAILLPELRHSRGARQASRKVRAMLDPGRELREARTAYEDAGSVVNRLRLADALVADGKPADAVPLYEGALTGLYAEDPEILVRKARALLESGRAGDAKATLDTLIAAKPDFRSAAGHLTYARAVAALGDRDKAREEFDVLIDYFPGLEARARYATLLRDWGDTARAREIAADAMRIASRLPAHSRAADREWIAALQRIDTGV